MWLCVSGRSLQVDSRLHCLTCPRGSTLDDGTGSQVWPWQEIAIFHRVMPSWSWYVIRSTAVDLVRRCVMIHPAAVLAAGGRHGGESMQKTGRAAPECAYDEMVQRGGHSMLVWRDAGNA